MLARPEINSQEHILLWLASKPADEYYNWSDCKRCACAQYAVENGLRGFARYTNLSRMNTLAFECYTFGQLYKRMRQEWSPDDWEAHKKTKI